MRNQWRKEGGNPTLDTRYIYTPEISTETWGWEVEVRTMVWPLLVTGPYRQLHIIATSSKTISRNKSTRRNTFTHEK